MSPVDQIKDTSVKTLLANGVQAFNDHLTTKIQAGLGRSLPQMEVRVKNLSVSADVVVGRHEDGRELPTLTHTIKTAALKLSTSKHVVHKTILRNFSGVFEPGTITLVLGQPSSGKSSLMKVLSGRFPEEKRVAVEGEITYNGVPHNELGSRLPQFVSYVDQHDVHFPTLTVKETLEFAHAFTGGELLRRGEELLTNGSTEENLEALKTMQTLFQHYPDIVIEQLGMQNCQNTIIGNGMLRGVSGGERKRVTTGEMEFGMKYMSLMDEISTGLDSATAFDIITTQRSIAKTLGKTVVISLLQPSPEIFELFDNVLILNAGEVMYHGPRDQALPYFESLGFRCPPHRDTADFLLDLDEYVLATTPTSGRKTPAMGAQTNENVALNVRATTKTFEPVVIAFQDLWYSVPDPHNPKESLTLLKGISGYAMPGSITALMGSTGAGKTTLMDVIAGRKTGGTIQGKILLNGYEANDLAIRRCTGYCEQMDIHSDASTIREALIFSAFLRQDSSVPDSQKYDSVEECLELLDLQSVADEIVRGSPTERMKRLTIGVELAADPKVLFLDEPTSGLDARSAKLIMDGVRKVADTGRTIVCTIHQPSTEVFMLFDKLLLLKRGGQTVYFGDLGKRAQTMVDYFEAIPGVTPLREGYNPATWMLECIGAGVSHLNDNPVDYVEFFNSSDMKHEMDVQLSLEGVTVPIPGSSEMLFGKKRAASSLTQMKALVRRFMNLYWRTPSTNLTRLVIMPLLGLVFGLVYVGTDYTSYQGINAGVGMVFLTSYFTGVVSFNSALPITSEDRPAFYREREAQTYSAFWYFIGSTVVEIPYVFGSMLLYTVIFYWTVGFSGFGTALLYWINTSLMVLLQTYMGQLLIYSMSSIDVAALVGVMIYSITILFYGFNPPATDIPAGYQWLYTICPQRYSLAILAALVFSQCDDLPTYNTTTQQYVNVGDDLGCQPVTNPPTSIDHITIKEYVESTFEYKHDEIWRNFGIVLVFIVILRLMALLSLRFINHQKK
ncbi:ABC transporter G family member 29 [Phytophthora cactorum]|uniref:ABC transporter G family member 29 n=4 Tax=Phytophthora cactorum TaxID=29920 RepID=A0A329SLR7_9STRA|nr:ABC transporter G family member 29 [Phytophthora cactorum]